MKVDIEELKYLFTCLHSEGPPCDMHARLHEALNELEELRADNQRQQSVIQSKDHEIGDLKVDRSKYRDMLARKELEIERLNGIIETMRTETSPFETWFKNHHPETIESITFTLRKKESN